MDRKIYGVALIGCGSMGEEHIKNIYYKQNVNIRVVCDTDVKRAKNLKVKYNAQRIETDYNKVVSSEDVDVVIIATYPSTHYAILKECIEHGKHVICEKPLSDNLEDAKKMAKLITDNPETKVLVGYILRHNKTYQKVKEMISSGKIGFPVIMRMSQNHHTMDWNKYLNLIKETSPIVDCGVHYLDVMRWFTGAEIIDINGIGLRTEDDVPLGKYNYGLITVKLSDGSICYYEAGWGNTMSSDNLKEFIGPKGRIRITYQMFRNQHVEEGDLIEYYKYPEKTYEMINLNSNRKPTGDQFDCLINMIEKGTEACPKMEDVMKSFEWAIKADEIIKSGL